MWEMMHVFALSANTRTAVFLCEAPGGFVQAAQDLVPSLEWQAWSLEEGPHFHATLKPRSSLGWADLRTHQGRTHVTEQVLRAHPNGVTLVTGDGAAPMDHANLEKEMIHLFQQQVDVALTILAHGGTFIVKGFEFHTRASNASWKCCAHPFVT